MTSQGPGDRPTIYRRLIHIQQYQVGLLSFYLIKCLLTIMGKDASKPLRKVGLLQSPLNHGTVDALAAPDLIGAPRSRRDARRRRPKERQAAPDPPFAIEPQTTVRAEDGRGFASNEPTPEEEKKPFERAQSHQRLVRCSLHSLGHSDQ